MSRWEHLIGEGVLLNLDRTQKIECHDQETNGPTSYRVLFETDHDNYNADFKNKKLRDKYFSELVKDLTEEQKAENAYRFISKGEYGYDSDLKTRISTEETPCK